MTSRTVPRTPRAFFSLYSRDNKWGWPGERGTDFRSLRALSHSLVGARPRRAGLDLSSGLVGGVGGLLTQGTCFRISCKVNILCHIRYELHVIWDSFGLLTQEKSRNHWHSAHFEIPY